ncbi:MAG TPA: glycoside hydrolase family 18 protein [Rhodothermales bacterium]|nr:glycoside hydrolase family 18 protein [Rhodothermales bacterium]
MSNTVPDLRRSPRWNVLPVFLILGLMASACSSTRPGRTSSAILPQNRTEAPRYIISPYLFGARLDISQIRAEEITGINYAFALVNDKGEIYFRNPERAAQHLAQLQALKAKNPNLKIIISVGGWGADGFSDAVLTDASREKFAASIIEMIKNYGLDGVDLDWEYPGQPGPGIKYRPEDKHNFTLALKTIREHLDHLSDERGRSGYDRYKLTIATAGGEYFEHTEMGKLHQYLDYVNVMAYDLFGSGPITGFHSGLDQSDFPGAATRTTVNLVEQHLAAGVPPRKIVVGSAFYGKGWAGVNPAHNGRNQPYERAYGRFSYRVLVEQYINKNGFRRYWDDAAQAPYLWNADSTIFIGYDDPQSLRAKAAYVKKMGLGGMMWWEHSQDYNNELLDAVYETFYE